MGDSLALLSLERKVNTGRLNMSGKQESEHKAHPK